MKIEKASHLICFIAAGFCLSLRSAACPPQPPPPCYTPSSPVLTLTTLDECRIALTWTDAANETGYKIYRKAEGQANYTQIKTLAADIVSYTDTGLACKTKYYYYVKAYNDCSVSVSGVKNAATYCCPANKASDPYPADRSIGISTGAVLSWAPGEYAVAHHIYLDVDKNSVLNAVNPNSYPGRAVITNGQCHYDPAGLKPGTTYYWRVDNIYSTATVCQEIIHGDVWEFTVGALIYVNEKASGGLNNGSSWENAYLRLSDALSKVVPNSEIWVAQGRYIPPVEGFAIPEGVAVYGGFQGIEASRQDRDFVKYKTVFSGDVERNDASEKSETYKDNTGAVIIANDNVIIDGITISGAYGRNVSAGGGVVLNKAGCTFALQNCVLTDNTGILGGGLSSLHSSTEITIINCEISANHAVAGAGVCILQGSLVIQETIIKNNCADSIGGGISISGGQMCLENTLIAGNSARDGGGICVAGIDVNINNNITNCTISENKAAEAGGGLYVSGEHNLLLKNTIIWENIASESTSEAVYSDAPLLTEYCAIQGAYNNSSSADPLFVSPGRWANSLWQAGDYHLQKTSPYIDAGTAVSLAKDLEGNTRPFDYPRVDHNGSLPDYDLGAYETAFKSFSFTVAADVRPGPGSINLQAWQHLLNEINTNSQLQIVRNESEFMVLLGDIDPPSGTENEINNILGSVFKYPVVGEHDFENAANMNWFYTVYDSQAQTYVRSGPVNGLRTSYSWDYGFVHCVVLNVYYNGTGDTLTDGDVCDALYNWLAADLAANTKPFIMVMGHEPAYVTSGDKSGNSLDKYVTHRNRFWTLLEQHKAKAYFCGHTHFYENSNPNDSIVKQIITGSAGEAGPDGYYRFLNVQVTDKDVYTTSYKASLNGKAIPENDRPAAQDVSLQVEEGSYIIIDFADYAPSTQQRYVSDRNQTYDLLTLNTLHSPRGEFIILQQDKTTLKYKYTSGTGFTGEDVFQYVIDDNSGTENARSQVAAIKITVYPRNRSPLAGDGWGYYCSQPVTINLSSYTADRDGDILRYEVLQNPEYGTVDVSALPNVTYTPDPLNHQPTTFVYRVCDGHDVSRNATIALVPNAGNLPPTADHLDAICMDEDSGEIEITVSGSDPEGQTLTFFHYHTQMAQDDFGPYKTNARHSIDQGYLYKKEGMHNVFIYKPARNENGTDYFRFYAFDGETRSEPVEVVIHITPVNDRPVFNGPDCVNAQKNNNLEFSLELYDPDNDPFYYALNKKEPFHGNIQYTLPPGLLYTHEQNNVEDSYFEVMIGDRPTGYPERLEIKPNPVVQVQVLNDGEDAPEALNLRVTTHEDVKIEQAEPYSTAENALILKSVDNDDVIQGHSYIIDELPDPSFGSLYRDGRLVVCGQTLSGPELAFEPAYDVYGDVTFTYHAFIPGSGLRSNGATVTIDILSVNDAPRVYEDKKCTLSGSQLRFRLSAEDVDRDSLRWFVEEAGENEQTARLEKGVLKWEQDCFVYTPDAGASGQDQFHYYANDGQTDSNIETCFINITDECVELKAKSGSLIIDEDQAGGGLVSLELQEGNRDAPDVTFEIFGESNVYGTLIKGQTSYNYTYIPNQDYNGTVKFRFRACGTYSNSEAATFTIEVRPVNDAPLAGHIELYPDENSPVSFDLPGRDVENDWVYFSKISEPAHGSAVQLFPEGKQCKYTPQTDYFGHDEFRFQVFDRVSDEDLGTQSEGTVAIRVIQAGMGVPQALNQIIEMDEDSSREISLTATDANNDALKYQIVVSPEQDQGTYYRLTNGILIKTNWSQNYVYRPDPDYFGTDSFQFKALELAPKTGESNVATVTITIHPVNDAPRLTEQLYFAEQYTLSPILLAAVDPEGDAISYKVLTQPVFGQLSGTIPNLSYYSEACGTDILEVQLSDETDTAIEPAYILITGQQIKFERKYFSYDNLAAFGTAVAASEIDGETFLAVASTSSAIDPGRVDVYAVTQSHLQHFQTLPLPAVVNRGYGIGMKMQGGIIVVSNHDGMPVSLTETIL